VKILQTTFKNRDELIAFVKKLSPYASGPVSSIIGGEEEARKRLKMIDPVTYGRTRNYGDGSVTQLSPYIHHGLIDLNEIRSYALKLASKEEQTTKFIQELAWRDFWQRVADKHPEWVWKDVEEYKTGFRKNDYQDKLPDDILEGLTPEVCINSFIHNLIETGYIHNHARMYLASYIVHFRRVKWQAGAKWFLEHLLDGDEASNNFSWQWVASTFSSKPYFFNLENVHKYFGNLVDTRPENNSILDGTYEEITARIFPQLKRYHE
jgi:deoxyribodipyrimidine photo-lyase